MRGTGSNDMAGIESWYSVLVARLEQEASMAPSRYKRRLFFLSMLGYAYPFVVLVGVLALILVILHLLFLAPGFFVFGVKFFVFPLLILSFAIFRSFWVRLPSPEGRRILRTETPRLFQLCESLQERLRGPPVHRIFMTDEFNAGIVQIPRLGFLGWRRNYLVVGFPMMLALSPEQFEAVLAHEYGHLSGAHGRFSARVYQMRQTWILLAAALENKSKWGAFLFASFFGWFAPYFNAYSFVLARSQEFEADRCASAMVGPRVAADALIDSAIRANAVEHYLWPKLWKHANRKAEPPYLPYERMVDFLKKPLDAEFAQQSLRRILAEETGIEDTHPSPADRLNAMGQEARVPQGLELSAAEDLLGRVLSDLVGEIDEDWRIASLPYWQEQYQQAAEWYRELAELDTKESSGSLDADEAWRKAVLTEELEDAAAAAPLYRSLLERDSKHAGANFAVGRIMLEGGDFDGLDFLEVAMESDEEAIIPACELAYHYLLEANRKDEAQSYMDRALPFYELQQRRSEEAAAVRPVEGGETFEDKIWREHSVAGSKALALGDYFEAEDWFKSALIEAERFGPKDPRLVTSLANLAELYRAHGKHAEATEVQARIKEINSSQKSYGGLDKE